METVQAVTPLHIAPICWSHRFHSSSFLVIIMCHVIIFRDHSAQRSKNWQIQKTQNREGKFLICLSAFSVCFMHSYIVCYRH